MKLREAPETLKDDVSRQALAAAMFIVLGLIFGVGLIVFMFVVSCPGQVQGTVRVQVKEANAALAPDAVPEPPPAVVGQWHEYSEHLSSLNPETRHALHEALSVLPSGVRVRITRAGVDVREQLKRFFHSCVWTKSVRANIRAAQSSDAVVSLFNDTCDRHLGEPYVCRPFVQSELTHDKLITGVYGDYDLLMRVMEPHLDARLCPHTAGVAVDVWVSGALDAVTPPIDQFVKVMADHGFCLNAGVALSPDHEGDGHWEYPKMSLGCIVPERVGYIEDRLGRRLVVTEPRKFQPLAPKEAQAAVVHGPMTREEAREHHYRLGNQYVIAQRYEEAVAEYREALNIDTNFAVAWRGLGVAYASWRKAEEAAAAYRRYLELAPDALDAEQVRKILGDYEKQEGNSK